MEEVMKRILAILLFTAAASAMPTPVSDLPTGCTYNSGTTCAKTYDSTSGVCRTICFSTSAGEIQVLVCDKTDHYELYRQSYPSGITFKATVGGGSVDQLSGFSSFTSTGTTTQALVDPNSAGFGGQTRATNHATLLGLWWNDTRLVQQLDCVYGQAQCAWVPWYSVSHSCNATDLHKPDEKCGGSGTPSLTNNCMVTDEFSQVFLATAQGTNNDRVKKLFNTLRVIAGIHGTLPGWVARQTNQTITLHSTDSASDADARILLALYIAAASPSFPQADRDAYRNYANTMAADFLQHDFRNEPRPGRNGVTITRWLAGGGNAANGQLSYDYFTYAGYFGDATIALLAAYKSLNQSQYLDAAKDTINAYLLASDFNSSFRVPPKTFRWDTLVTPAHATCSPGACTGAWDDSDAPRATSLCKAKYYATLLGVSLPADLDLYCNAWRSRGGVTATTYIIQYAFDGTPVSNPQDGPYENGLALSLDFAYGTNLVSRLNQVGTKWNGSNGWWGQTCTGVYRNAFFTVNLGSAIGRDRSAFQ
jgi:hypothetical protein